MSLATPPTPPTLITPDAPFLVTAIWQGYAGAPIETPQLYIAAAEYPGAWPHEYAIGPQLLRPLGEVEPDELPIVLALRARQAEQGGEAYSYWAFDYLGGPEFFAADQLAPPIPVVAPTPMSAEQLSHQAQALLRDSLGLEEDQPLAEPAGELPAAEQPEEPYRFDPHPHMDLSKAEPPPEFHGEAPASAPPGPPPDPSATTAPVPAVPPPAPAAPPPPPDAEPFVH